MNYLPSKLLGMSMQAKFIHRAMIFKKASGTSRGILRQKDSWFLQLHNEEGQQGLGECSTISKLSPDLTNDLESGRKNLVKCLASGLDFTINDPLFDGLPSLKFCYEMAALDLANGGKKKLFDSSFLNGEGIPINGLVWMGNKAFMYEQIVAHIESGYRCIKLKIAAIDFMEEISLLKYIRSQFTPEEIEIRVDANGGFSNGSALEKLKLLSDYLLHSIEQPIKAGQYDLMAELCSKSPLDIALDEELIGLNTIEEKSRLLQTIQPQYLILKPSLVGGFAASEEWITLATDAKVGWWITSALEANIGLNAIAQWTASLESPMYQGLGTGQLFTNNLRSPLYIENGQLFYGQQDWEEMEF